MLRYSARIAGFLSTLGLFFSIVVCAAVNNGKIKVKDDTGHWLTLKTPARRIISLAPDLTELLFAAGAGNAVVGVDKASNYPHSVQDLPKIANYQSLNLETIVALHPDLIVAWYGGSPARQVDKLAKLGIPIYYYAPHHITAIANTLLTLGKLAGTSATADIAAKKFMQQYHHLQVRYSKQTPIKVFYQIWPRPILTVNGNSMISRVIHLCGGRNVFANLPSIAGQVSTEALLAANVQAIILGGGKKLTGQPWLGLTGIPAVRLGNIYSIPPSLIERNGPRLLQGAKLLCQDLAKARTVLTNIGSQHIINHCKDPNCS